MNTHCFSERLSGNLAHPRADLHGLGEGDLFSFAVSGVILASVVVGAVAAIICLAI